MPFFSHQPRGHRVILFKAQTNENSVKMGTRSTGFDPDTPLWVQLTFVYSIDRRIILYEHLSKTQ